MPNEPEREGRLRSFAELAEPDQMTARFSGPGFLTQGTLSSEGSARYLQEMVVGALLGPRVPGEITRSFERIRELHVYGLFEYGFFTLADQAAWGLPETALGCRFVETYSGQIPFTRGIGAASLEAQMFSSVVEAVGSGGKFSRRNDWYLEGHGDYGDGRSFDGSYWSLIQWAWRQRLLDRWLDDRWASREDQIRYSLVTQGRGPDDSMRTAEAQRAWWTNYKDEVWAPADLQTLVTLRNLVAHPMAGHIVAPPDSARALVSVADFINALWP